MNMFYTTDVSVTLWVINRNKKARDVNQGELTTHYRDRDNKVLFMDLRNFGEPFEKKFLQLSEQEINKIATTFHSWRTPLEDSGYQDIPEFCRSVQKEEIAAKNYSLAPSSYIKFEDRDLQVDLATNIQAIKTELEILLAEEKKSNISLHRVFKEFGYEFNL